MLERFFTPGTSIGGIFRGLRQSHGPLGLLYGAYCPPDLHVRAEDASPGDTNPQIEKLTGAGGRMLAPREPTWSRPKRSCGSTPTRRPLPALSRTMVPNIAHFFDGRDDDVARFAMILDRPETRVLVLHGESGVGKTSFLRAGLIPYLEEDCIGYRFLRDYSDSYHGERTSPVLFIRARTTRPARSPGRSSSSPPSHLSTQPRRARRSTQASPPRPRPCMGTTEPPTAAALSERLLADPSLLSQVLARLSRPLPVTPVLVIDQAEEMFTLARSPDGSSGRRPRARDDPPGRRPPG